VAFVVLTKNSQSDHHTIIINHWQVFFHCRLILYIYILYLHSNPVKIKNLSHTLLFWWETCNVHNQLDSYNSIYHWMFYPSVKISIHFPGCCLCAMNAWSQLLFWSDFVVLHKSVWNDMYVPLQTYSFSASNRSQLISTGSPMGFNCWVLEIINGMCYRPIGLDILSQCQYFSFWTYVI
jgi:hypothetical protein